MTGKLSKRRFKWLTVAAVLLLFVLAVLSWFQFFYRARQVDGGIFTLDKVFREHTHVVQAVKFSPDGVLIASGSVDGTVKVRNKETGRVIYNLKHPAGITYFDYSADGNYIVTAAYDQVIRLWKLPEAKLIREFKGHTRTPWAVAFSPDGKLIASASEETTIRLWQTETGKLLNTLSGHKLNIWSLQFSPDGTKLASGSYDETLKIWNVVDGTLSTSIHGHTEAIVAIAYSHDGQSIATAADDEKIKIWNAVNGSLLTTLEGSEEHVQAVAFSPDDKWLITGGRDKPGVGELLQEIFGDSKINKGVSMRLWDIQYRKMLQTFSMHENDATDMAFSPDGKWITSSSADHTVALWRRASK